MKFYNAIKRAYPDIQIISNCDGSKSPLKHPADFYDFHVTFQYKQIFLIFFFLNLQQICHSSTF